ncbi:MAG: GEVED domain-containing protein [Ardenticatenaceae bacterium]|nr:GEVED domain-containing protein [Ardenticatenaceae bacterium]
MKTSSPFNSSLFQFVRNSFSGRWPLLTLVLLLLLFIGQTWNAPAAAAAPAAITKVSPIQECVIVVSEAGLGATVTDADWIAVLGYQLSNYSTGDSLTLPHGSNNEVKVGNTDVTSDPSKFFNAQQSPTQFKHPVAMHSSWPEFSSGYTLYREQRSGFWTAPDATMVKANTGQNVKWKIKAGSSQQKVVNSPGSTTQRCSYHVFLEKTWDGSKTPPAELNKTNYRLRLNSEIATVECRYQDLQRDASGFHGPTAVWGANGNTLNCFYDTDSTRHTGWNFSTDEFGAWVPVGFTYDIVEENAPAGWTADGVDTGFTNNHGIFNFGAAEKQHSQHGFYPGYEGWAASDGTTYGNPRPGYSKFGDTSGKWTLHTSASTSSRDWGDLPESGFSFATEAASGGAAHNISGPYLGSCVDGESSGFPSINADGEDVAASNTSGTTGSCSTANDDEDGVSRTGNWSDGTGDLLVEASGAACLNVWLDFTNGSTAGSDGDFDDTMSGIDEHVVENQVITTGTSPISFALPAGVADNGTFYLRARLTAQDSGGGCSGAEAYGGTAASAGLATSGEVEDYQFAFSPTAVTLNGVSIAATNTGYVWVLFFSVLVLCWVSIVTFKHWLAREPVVVDE